MMEEEKEAYKVEKCKNVPGPRWHGDTKRDKYFSDLYLKLSYFQQQLPMLKEIESEPEYAKYYDGHQSKEVECILQHSLPKKLNDLGDFSINIPFGNKEEVRAIIDLGAACNLMPSSVYSKIGVGELKPAKLRLEMADKSTKRTKGLLEDALVRIDEPIFPVDFIVLELEDGLNRNEEPYLLLGRPFMATTRMEISMRDESIKMTVLGKTLRLEIFYDNLPPLYSSKNANFCFDEIMMKQVKENIRTVYLHTEVDKHIFNLDFLAIFTHFS